MLAPTFLSMVVNGAFAYGCMSLILRHYGVSLPMGHPYFAVMVDWTAPVLLFVFAAIAWAKLRNWRRMEALRQPADALATRLARGEHRLERYDAYSRASLPERFAGLLVCLALATVPFWQGMPLPEAWLGLGIVIVLITRAMLPRH